MLGAYRMPTVETIFIIILFRIMSPKQMMTEMIHHISILRNPVMYIYAVSVQKEACTLLSIVAFATCPVQWLIIFVTFATTPGDTTTLQTHEEVEGKPPREKPAFTESTPSSTGMYILEHAAVLNACCCEFI